MKREKNAKKNEVPFPSTKLQNIAGLKSTLFLEKL